MIGMRGMRGMRGMCILGLEKRLQPHVSSHYCDAASAPCFFSLLRRGFSPMFLFTIATRLQPVAIEGKKKVFLFQQKLNSLIPNHPNPSFIFPNSSHPPNPSHS
jgi:hypothetical protein